MRIFWGASQVFVVCVWVAGLIGCSDLVSVDSSEGVDPTNPNGAPGSGAVIEFQIGDSAAGEDTFIPFPNNLLRSGGVVQIPAQCFEDPITQATREHVLNTLNGFASYKLPIKVTFSRPIRLDSLRTAIPGDVLSRGLATRAFLLKRLNADGSVVSAGDANPIPLLVTPGEEVRLVNGCSAVQTVDNVVFTALADPMFQQAAVLDPGATYTMVIANGADADSTLVDIEGGMVGVSRTWFYIRGNQAPVELNSDGSIAVNRTPLDSVRDLEQLQGLAALWRAYVPMLSFASEALELQRKDILIAWEFSVQNGSDTLDVSVDGSLAETILNTDTGVSGVAMYTQAQVLGAGSAADSAVLAAVQAVDATVSMDDLCPSVLSPCLKSLEKNMFTSVNLLREQVNPNGEEDAEAVPLYWDGFEPAIDASTMTQALPFYVFVPDTPEPSDGYPVVFFGHGLGLDATSSFVVGPLMAKSLGAVVVAMDWVLHGDRAVNIAAEGESVINQPIFSTDLGTTRDNLRQSVLDMLSLIEAIKSCTTQNCGFEVDVGRFAYVGQSLGALIGNLVVANSPDIGAAVLNVGGAGWIDILENTQTAGFKCPIVDALIATGAVAGTLCNYDTDIGACVDTTATCLGTDWLSAPAWLQLAATARWIVGPADGLNFAAKLREKSILIQEVAGDRVVPNAATENLGKLLGLTQVTASDDTVSSSANIEVLSLSSGDSLWLRYVSSTTMPETHVYGHGALLVPAIEGSSAALNATTQMRTDAMTYLLLNQ